MDNSIGLRYATILSPGIDLEPEPFVTIPSQSIGKEHICIHAP